MDVAHDVVLRALLADAEAVGDRDAHPVFSAIREMYRGREAGLGCFCTSFMSGHTSEAIGEDRRRVAQDTLRDRSYGSRKRTQHVVRRAGRLHLRPVRRLREDGLSMWSARG